MSKAHLDGCADGQGKPWRVSNTEADIATLVGSLAAKTPAGQRVLVIVEASGGQERALCRALHAAQIPVHVANPQRVRDDARAIGWKAKTDRIDAALLARYGARETPAPQSRLGRASVVCLPLARQALTLAAQRAMATPWPSTIRCITACLRSR